MSIKKTAALGTAAALLLTAAPCIPVSAAEDSTLKFEFEDGTLVDCEESAPITWEQVDEDAEGNPCDMTGWSGDSYVYIDDKDSYVALKVNVPEEGFYALGISYIQCFGTPHKIQYLQINGESQGEICFPFNSGKGWEQLEAGYVRLNKGENEIRIVSYWGYTFLDYLTLSPAPSYVTNLSPTPSLCNPNASEEAQKVYAYLQSVYGEHVLSGQQEYCGSHCYNKDSYVQQGLPVNYFEDNEAEFEYLQEVTGKQPAIRGIDFLFYNTTQPYYDDAPERVIAWYKEKGGIPTVTFHWNVPTEEGSDTAAFYVESAANGSAFTTFSATNAVKEGTWENQKINEDLALLAEQFQKIEDAGVPVIFRPLHEAEGAWFWWGAEGPEACKELYYYVWNTLTKDYGLDNIIWEWTSYTYSSSPEWYPGDEYVDLIGYDKYNAVDFQPNLSAISATFYSLVASTEGAKMVCMSENDTIPSLENLQDSKAGWLYFCPWYQQYLTSLNSKEELEKIYNSDYCITLDELPDWDTYDPEIVTTPPAETTDSETTDADTTVSDTTSTTAKEELLLGDVDCNGEIKIDDAVLLCRLVSADETANISEKGRLQANYNQDSAINADDTVALLQFLAGISLSAA